MSEYIPSRCETLTSTSSRLSVRPNSTPKSAMPRSLSSMAKAREEAKEMVSTP